LTDGTESNIENRRFFDARKTTLEEKMSGPYGQPGVPAGVLLAQNLSPRDCRKVTVRRE